MAAYDVIVVGLGGMGSAAAYQLAARGVAGARAWRSSARRTTGGPATAARGSPGSPTSRAPTTCRCCCARTSCTTQLARDSGTDVIRLTGGVMVGRPESLTVSGSLLSAEQWGLAHEMLDAADAAPALPDAEPAPGRGGALRGQGRLRAPGGDRGGAAHAGHPGRRRAALRRADDAAGRRHPAAGYGCGTASGRTGRAAGHHARARGRRSCWPTWACRSPSNGRCSTGSSRPAGSAPFRPERHPIYIWEDAGGSQIYGFPAIDGPDGGAKVGVLPARHGRPPRRPSTARCTTDEIARDGRPAPAQLPDLPGTFLTRQDLPVQQHPGRALRDRPAPGARGGHGRVRLLRARLQVRARWSARSWPTWPPRARPGTRSTCSTRAASQG